MAVENSEKIVVEPKDKSREKEKRGGKSWVVLLFLGILSFCGGVAGILVGILTPKPEIAELSFPKLPSAREDSNIYSRLTGLPVSSAEELTAPTYCIQVPNGTDGARPQAGLDEAGVVFEAIAEAGITRFAAVFQNPKSAVIGPIRSLRLYYLQWDTPFDCTIVHAGGADDALAAVRNGGYKDLTENYSYMYRSYVGNRLWNNLFTNGTDLAQFTSDRGYGTSEVNGFARMTPAEAERARVDATVAEKLVITEASEGKTAVLEPSATEIALNYGWAANFNVRYRYNPETNSYLRGYASGAAHNNYVCPKEGMGEVAPEGSCRLEQLSPAVVVAMMVEQQKASDNYHEDITAIGEGVAYIFQNGVAIKGTWKKGSVSEQIRFYDSEGTEVRLVPGQAFVSAVPNYGSVEY